VACTFFDSMAARFRRAAFFALSAGIGLISVK
jgi:hypothetical protein